MLCYTVNDKALYNVAVSINKCSACEFNLLQFLLYLISWWMYVCTCR